MGIMTSTHSICR